MVVRDDHTDVVRMIRARVPRRPHRPDESEATNVLPPIIGWAEAGADVAALVTGDQSGIAPPLEEL
jgi:hypothetical protein